MMDWPVVIFIKFVNNCLIIQDKNIGFVLSQSCKLFTSFEKCTLTQERLLGMHVGFARNRRVCCCNYPAASIS